MKCVAVLIAALALAGCDSNSSLQADARAAIAATLADPQSAEFSDVFSPPSPNRMQAVCGWVTGRSVLNPTGERLRFAFSKRSGMAVVEVPSDVRADRNVINDNRELFEMTWRDTCEAPTATSS